MSSSAAALLPSARWRWMAGWVGTLPQGMALESGPLTAAAVACLPVALAAAGLRPPGLVLWPCLAAASLWFLLAAAAACQFGARRRLSRRAGLGVLVAVPETPALLCWRLRRRGVVVTPRAHALSVHVDPLWRRPAGLDPAGAARLFGAGYRADYDRLLAALAGHPVLVLSSTFNRHDSPWTSRAAAEGWCRAAAGPLFANAPRRQGAAVRQREQVAMFGAVVSGRPVDHAAAWRTRVFDCGLAPFAGSAADGRHGAAGVPGASGAPGASGERGGPPGTGAVAEVTLRRCGAPVGRHCGQRVPAGGMEP